MLLNLASCSTFLEAPPNNSQAKNALCQTDLMKTMFSVMSMIAPISYNKDPFYVDLLNFKNEVCSSISLSGDDSKIKDYRSKAVNICVLYGRFYSDFEWKCKKLWDIFFDPTFLTVNRKIYSILGQKPLNQTRNALSLALQLRNLNYSNKKFQYYETLATVIDYHALSSNINIIYKPTGLYQYHFIFHAYLKKLANKKKIKAKVIMNEDKNLKETNSNGDEIDIFEPCFKQINVKFFELCILVNIILVFYYLY